MNEPSVKTKEIKEAWYFRIFVKYPKVNLIEHPKTMRKKIFTASLL